MDIAFPPANSFVKRFLGELWMDKKIGHVMKVTEKLMFNGKDFFWVQEENEVNHLAMSQQTVDK